MVKVYRRSQPRCATAPDIEAASDLRLAICDVDVPRVQPRAWTWSSCADSFFPIIMKLMMIRCTGQPTRTVLYPPLHSLDPSAKKLPVG